MRLLLAYDSLSGNTREAAHLAAESFARRGHTVEPIHVSLRQDQPLAPAYDLVLLGTWTGGLGRTPAGMKAFVARLAADGIHPRDLALFGTGETQWGLPYFCGALDRLAAHFASDYPQLKLEQMPATPHARQAIEDWAAAVLAHHAARHSPLTSP